jgi:hypothetical protein
VWGLKEFFPGGLSCQDVSITFTEEELGTGTDSFLNTRTNEHLQTGLGSFAYLQIIVYGFAMNDFSL